MIYDTIIIGGGPTGTASAVYAARKQMKTLLITESFGGQSIVSNDIDNWIGDIKLTGFELAQKFEKHVKAQSNIDIIEGDLANKITKIDSVKNYPIYQVDTENGKSFQAKTLILGLGAKRRKLGLEREEELTGKGVAYCATCDAPFFSNVPVGVVGSGNSGLESALDLLSYASEVYLFNRTENIKGDPDKVDKLNTYPNFKGFIHNSQVSKFIGETKLESIEYTNLINNEVKSLPLQGLFIEIGSIPNSEMVKDLVNINSYGEIIIDHKYSSTSAPGIFAAGDVTDEAYKQNNISAGDAVKATLSAYHYIHNLK